RDEVPPAAGAWPGPGDAARRRGDHRLSEVGDEVDAGVEAVSARAEGVSDRREDGPGQRDGGARWRPAEGGDRRGAGDRVGRQAGEALEAGQGAGEPRSETGGDGPGGEALPCQRDP